MHFGPVRGRGAAATAAAVALAPSPGATALIVGSTFITLEAADETKFVAELTRPPVLVSSVEAPLVGLEPATTFFVGLSSCGGFCC
mmetsp:Transcript_35393/g.53220  ORF Transcript_35393/g.53220 Transcript_35393/m.53220 type:complete len:86 (+) Transcript_35393:727-984(+)